jgi:hypothetical protein
VVCNFVEVLCPRVSHWSKGKGTVAEGFDNGRLEGRPSSVDLRRFEPPWGKGLEDEGFWEGGVAR